MAGFWKLLTHFSIWNAQSLLIVMGTTFANPQRDFDYFPACTFLTIFLSSTILASEGGQRMMLVFRAHFSTHWHCWVCVFQLHSIRSHSPFTSLDTKCEHEKWCITGKKKGLEWKIFSTLNTCVLTTTVILICIIWLLCLCEFIPSPHLIPHKGCIT